MILLFCGVNTVVVYPSKSNSFKYYFQAGLVMDIRITFGKVLKRIRKQKKISQERLALDADLDRAHISKLEHGVYQPNLSTIFALAKILECKPSELVEAVEVEINSN